MPIATFNENNRTISGREEGVFSDHRSKHVQNVLCSILFHRSTAVVDEGRNMGIEIRKLLSVLSDYNLNLTGLTLSNETHCTLTIREIMKKIMKEVKLFYH